MDAPPFYDDAGNIVRRNESSYTYDKTNRLTIANERGRFAAEAKADGAKLGRAEGDYTGEKELDFEAEEADVLFDYGSMSIGVDLGAEFEVARIELDPQVTGHRIDVNRMEFLYATFNEAGNWNKITDAGFEKTASGAILVRLRKPLSARYLKLHCFYDDLGADGKVVDRATVRNPLVKVGYFEKTRDERYAYDAKGNRRSVTMTFKGETRNSSWTYWPNTDRVKSDGTWGYTYDANGNLTEKGTVYVEESGALSFSETEGDYVRYEYDLSNRMTRVLRGDAGTASATERATYRYGPDGLRIAKTTSSGTRYYVYGIDGNELTETIGSTQTDTVWVLGKKYAEAVAITDTESGTVTETRTYLATDQVGSVVAATDETGKVIWQGSRTAFGEEGGEVGLAERAASYTGKDYDEESGLLYFNARWYDSGLAKFTTEDPIRDGANWYAYCGNNPLGSTDPSGLTGSNDNEGTRRGGQSGDSPSAETGQSGEGDSVSPSTVGQSDPASAGSPGTPTSAPTPAPQAQPPDDLARSPIAEPKEASQPKSPGDIFFVSYDVERGKAHTAYVPINEDGTVDYGGITTGNTNFSNNVNTKGAGREAPNGKTIPADGSAPQYYDPVNAPKGLWSNGPSRPSSDPDIVGPVVPTNAYAVVPVYGPVTGAVPSRDAEPTGTQRDTGYNYHTAINPGKPSSAGCPVTYGDKAVQEMTAFAAMNDAALGSGGTSTSYWH